MSVRALRRGTMAGRGAAAGPTVAPAFRASSITTAFGIVTSPWIVTLTIPAAVVTGDLMLISASSISHAPATPSGWTLVRSDVGAGTNASVCTTFRKFAVGGDTGGATTVNVTFASNQRYAISFLAYSGVAVSGTINISGVTVSTVSGTTATAPSVTTTSNFCRIVECYSTTENVGSTPTITGPATTRTNPKDLLIANAISDQALDVAGASGAKNATISHSGSWVGQTIALAPA